MRLPLLLLLGATLCAFDARAAGTGYWRTSGNQVRDANNQPVRIAAINWCCAPDHRRWLVSDLYQRRNHDFDQRPS